MPIRGRRIKLTEQKKIADWELIERHYRAGIKTLRQIGQEYGVSHTAVKQRATKFGWTRDLTEKIQQAAQALVTTKVVSKALSNSLSKERLLSDAETVHAYSEVVASVDMTQRSDIEMALNLSRSQMLELTALSNPAFTDDLSRLADLLDQGGQDDNGKVRTDKLNELYLYVISLPGRVKMVKEIAAAHGVYIPVQRKVFKLDVDEKANVSAYEDMLKAVGKS